MSNGLNIINYFVRSHYLLLLLFHRQLLMTVFTYLDRKGYFFCSFKREKQIQLVNLGQEQLH